MSKTTVKKMLDEFDADDLRRMVLDLYGKSKDVKALLDFYADPDVGKKLEEYKVPILKEVKRVKRGIPTPRMTRIRAMIKQFGLLDPGDEAVAELMVYTMVETCGATADSSTVRATTQKSIERFMADTVKYIVDRRMTEEFVPRLRKSVRDMKDGWFSKNPLKKSLTAILNQYSAADAPGCIPTKRAIFPLEV